MARINTTERQGGRKEEQPKVGPKGAAPKGRRKSNGEAEKPRGLFAARMERLFCKSPRKQVCRCLFKNPAIPASRVCPVFFLKANSWQFLHLAQGAKSRAVRVASERFRNRRVGKLACQKSLIQKRQHKPLVLSLGAHQCISVSFDSLAPSRLALSGCLAAVFRAAAQPPGCG